MFARFFSSTCWLKAIGLYMLPFYIGMLIGALQLGNSSVPLTVAGILIVFLYWIGRSLFSKPPATIFLERNWLPPPYSSRAQMLDLIGDSTISRNNPYWETCMETFIKCNIHAARLLDVEEEFEVRESLLGSASSSEEFVEDASLNESTSLWSGLELIRGVVRRAEYRGLGENVITELAQGTLSYTSDSSSLFVPDDCTDVSISDMSISFYEENDEDEAEGIIEAAGPGSASVEVSVEPSQHDSPQGGTQEMSSCQAELHKRLTASKAVFDRFGVWPGTVSGSKLPPLIDQLKAHSDTFKLKIFKLTSSFRDDDIECTQGWPEYEIEPLEFINLGEGMLIYRRKKVQELCRCMEEVSQALGSITSLQRMSQRGEVNFLVGRAQQVEFSANAWIQQCDKLLGRAWKYRKRGSHDSSWIDHKLKRESRLAKSLAEFFEETQQSNFYTSIPESCECLAEDYWNLIHAPIESYK